VQPIRKDLLAVRGLGTDYHFNQIKGWRVKADGTIVFEGGEA
jgi:hypothetical protein